MHSIVKTISIIVPLVSFIAYKVAFKPPFKSLSCALLGIGCRSGTPINGFVDPEYKEVYNLFLKNFEQGLDVGAAVSVYVDGKQVASLQGGWKDREEKISYSKDTLQLVFSNSKVLSAIVIAQMVEQGVLSYNERISTYWPEFGQGNKENVTLMDLMRHKAGVACLDRPLSFEQGSNSAVLADILAKQPHNFDGKPIHAYHAMTQGWVQNEILRRMDPLHRTVDDFAKEYREKWGIEWYLKPSATEGVDLKRIGRFYEKLMYQKVADLLSILLDPREKNDFIYGLFDKNSSFSRALVNPHMDQHNGITNSNPKHWSVEGPSYSGFTNADSMAKLAAMMANRGKAIVPGEPDIFTDDATFDDILQDLGYEEDFIFPFAHFHNLKGGLQLYPNDMYFQTSDEEVKFVGGIGAGGSTLLFNEKYKIGFAYVTNSYIDGVLVPDQRSVPVVKAIVEQVIKQRKNE